MTSRVLVVKALNHEPVPRIPRDVWLPAGEDAAENEDLAELLVRFPSDILTPNTTFESCQKYRRKPNRKGEFTDLWGCVWGPAENGAAAELKLSPLADWEKLVHFRPPEELFDSGRFTRASRLCGSTNRFVLAWSEVRPLDRLRQLHGENTLAELTHGGKEIRQLLAILHEAHCKELERWAQSEVDAVAFRDDWGTPGGLVLHTDVWRDLFRPLYREYCKILHAQDKFVFFHSLGNILDLFGELVRAGVDAIHADLHLMNLDRLLNRYRGSVTFWGGFDEKRLLNPGSLAEFREAVSTFRRALDVGAGGVIAQCRWQRGIRLQILAAFFEQWCVPLPVPS